MTAHTHTPATTESPGAPGRWQSRPGFRLLVWIVAGLVVGLSLRWMLIEGQPDTRDPGIALPPVPVVVSDQAGAFDTLVMHWDPLTEERTDATYAAFLNAIDADVRVIVPVADAETAERFLERARTWGVPSLDRLQPLLVDKEITTWSRDRYTLALRPPSLGRPGGEWVCLVSNRPQNHNEARANDAAVPGLLAAASDIIGCEIVSIRFDGGDLIASDDAVFVTRLAYRRNRDDLHPNAEQFWRIVADSFTAGGRELVLLDPGADGLVPAHHIGMFVTPIPGEPDELTALYRDEEGRWRFGARPTREVAGADGIGRGVVAVGSPDAAIYALIEAWDLDLDASLPAADLWQDVQAEMIRRGCLGADLSPARRARFATVERLLREQGFTVAPLPLVPLGELQFVTYNNVVRETRDDGSMHAYIPMFDGPDGQGGTLDLAALDSMALEAWRMLGYERHPIPVSRVFRLGGSVRCLVHTLKWRDVELAPHAAAGAVIAHTP